MKAAVWYNNKDIRIEEIDTPVPNENEILMKVNSCGVCGSDIVEWYRLPRAPLIPGHEASGEIVKIGSSVTGYCVGDRICVAPKIGCGECKYCKKGHHSICSEVKGRLPGAFSEFVLIPKELVKAIFKIPQTMDYEAATFIEPLACVVRAQKFANIKQGDSVLVIGSGMSGLLHIKLAIKKGAKVTSTDVSPYRIKIAESMGAKAIHASDNVDEKFDAVILCSGSMPAVNQAWKSVDKAGVVVMFTVPHPDNNVVVPLNDFWRKEVKIVHSYYCGPDDLDKSFRLINSGEFNVKDMITHRFKLEDVQEAFDVVMKADDSLKVLIVPQTF